MSMQYTINEWCATCGKAKQYIGVLGGNSANTPPEMCECNNTVSIRPANTAPPYFVSILGVNLEQAKAIRASYKQPMLTDNRKVKIIPPQICIAPESMQEIEEMVRRVVSEELTKTFNAITKFVFHDEDSE